MHWREHWKPAWMRYPLWLWGTATVFAWTLLPANIMRMITPYVGGGLLMATAVMLYWIRQALESRARDVELQSELRILMGAILTTFSIGAALPLLLPAMAGGSIEVGESRIAWILCSGGFVLTTILTRLVLAYVDSQRRFCESEASALAGPELREKNVAEK